MVLEDSRERLEEIASAVEDLIHMGAISVEQDSRGRISPRMLEIIVRLRDSQQDTEPDRTMNLMYYSLLIFMNEELRLSKAFTMALASDLEKHRDDMQTGALVSTYVQILAQISSRKDASAV